MLRWLTGIAGLLLIIGSYGCKQQCFLSKEDFDRANHLIPSHVEDDLSAGVLPVSSLVAAPPDVNMPDRPARFLSLQEAIAISLENGVASSRGAGQGLVDDTLVSGSPGAGLNGQTDAIRVLALNPAAQAARTELALARFDALYVASMNWSQTDNLQQGLSSFTNGSRANFSSNVIKGLPTGGVVSTSFLVDYTLLSNPPAGQFGVINPSYTTRLVFGYEQPLLRNFGVEINQLLNQFPGTNGGAAPSQAAQAFSAQQNVSGVLGEFVDGILISRLKFDQQRAEFERQLQALVLNVEVAYWRMYQAYGRLYSFEEVLRIAHKSWQISKAKFDAGLTGFGTATFQPIRGQYEEFRGERTAALGAVLEAERNLRGLMGLPVEDGTRLVPVTAPTLAPYRPNWEIALQEALTLRPELVLARENLRIAQLNVIKAKNFLKPDLRFIAQYSPVGFGTRLDGRDNFIDGTNTPRPNNAIQSLTSNHFDDWTVGFTYAVPFGYRAEHSGVKLARLNLAQSYYLLKTQEDTTTRILTNQYQKLAEWYALIEQRRAERIAYGKGVEARFRELAQGKPVAEFLIEAQRRLALAQVKEYESIAEYNSTLARLEWSKGNLLNHNSVHIAEGQYPDAAAVRAVDNEKLRCAAMILRETPNAVGHPGRLAGSIGDLPTTLDPNAPIPSGALPPELDPKNAPPVVMPPATKVSEPKSSEPKGLAPKTPARGRPSLPPASESLPMPKEPLAIPTTTPPELNTTTKKLATPPSLPDAKASPSASSPGVKTAPTAGPGDLTGGVKKGFATPAPGAVSDLPKTPGIPLLDIPPPQTGREIGIPKVQLPPLPKADFPAFPGDDLPMVPQLPRDVGIPRAPVNVTLPPGLPSSSTPPPSTPTPLTSPLPELPSLPPDLDLPASPRVVPPPPLR